MDNDQLISNVKSALEDAGAALKSDLWRPEDEGFLAERARDLVALEAKAAMTADAGKRRAFSAAAKDVVNHVKLFAMIRMEASATHVVEDLGKFFMEKLVPALMQLLPMVVDAV